MCTVCVLYVYCMCTVCIIISVFFSFGVDPVNWQGFIEIVEMACSATAWCSRGHTTLLNVFLQ